MNPALLDRLLRRVGLRRRRLDDRGAILVIAIFVVAVVAVVTGAVLTRGEGSLRATVALRDVARSSYAADAAAQVAINGLRTGYEIGSGSGPTSEENNTPWYYTNKLGTGCFGYDGSGGSTVPKDILALANLIPKQAGETQDAMSAAVVCTPEDATGEQGTAVPINNANKPGNAILTLGTSGAERGFSFKTNGSGAAFRVRGGIWANSDIVRDNNGNLESTESIRAHTGCSPAAAMLAPLVDCSAATAPDPNYASDLDIAGTGIPELRIPPANCSGGMVELEPGYYDDVTKLNALTDTNQNCFIHLKPGPYYFDFHNNSADELYDADIASNAGNTWVIGSRKTVVGGSLTGDTSVPGRCVNPIDDVNAQGVQLIFGGDSRLLIEANGQATAVEFCATYHSSRPPIAIYGQKTGTVAQTVIAPADALTATATSGITPGTWTQADPGNLATANGNQATNADLAYWQRDATGSGNAVTRSLTMTGFAPDTDLPKGAVLTGARLKVTHRSTGENSAFTLTPNLGTAPISHTLPARANLGTEDVDLSTRPGWGAFQKAVHDEGFSGASIRFDASLRQDQIAQLDAVRLELTYYLPSLRGQTTAAVPGNTVATVGGEAVVKVLGNTTTFYVQGTTYVPRAKVDLSLNNIDESVFRFGVIARSLVVFETGSFSYPGAVIELPDNSPGFGFETTLVRLQVYLCPGAGGCTPAGGELALTARVKVFDEGGTPGPPNRQVSVLNWSHTR